MCKNKKTSKAFSLIELIVAMSIFSLVILISTSVFASVIAAKKKSKNVQRNLEDARYSLELMAKNIRMSTFVTNNGNPQAIYMYNNSQKQCISYVLFNSSTSIKEATFKPGMPDDCKISGNYSNYQPIVSGTIPSLLFDVATSSPGPKHMGRVVISVEIDAGNGNSADNVKIQTTVSLRDYNTVGI